MAEIESLYGRSVASAYEPVIAHITKHNLGVTPPQYIQIGDKLTGGKQGKFSGTFNGRHFTAVVDGKVCAPNTDGSTAIFGLLRSIRRGT